jgi:putative transcriptional regulator
MTQQDLAEKIGVSRQTINAMEANKYVPSTLLAMRIAHLFNIKVEEVFHLEEADLM